MIEKRSKKGGSVSSASLGSNLAVRSPRYTLTSDFDSIFNQFRRSFNDLMAPLLPLTASSSTILGEMPARFPAVDLVDSGDHYTVTAELPGFRKDNVNIEVNSDELHIRASKKSETEEKKKNYVHRERSYSAFERSIAFPEEVIPSKVEGGMTDGILDLRIQKKKPKPERKMTKVTLK